MSAPVTGLRFERRERQSLDGLKRDWRGRWSWGGEGPLLAFAVVALDGDREAGRFQFFVNDRRLIAKGTYVRPAYRRQRLASRLWQDAIAWKAPRSVTVACVTASGLRLVRRLQRELPKLRWNVFDDREDAA
jgi:GNAT superfamily N-acetyltransferase